jgi:hypothetical protein
MGMLKGEFGNSDAFFHKFPLYEFFLWISLPHPPHHHHHHPSDENVPKLKLVIGPHFF